jgi:molybdopterin converting factor small subunit
MTVRVQFFSYLRDKAGCAGAEESLPEGATLGELHERVESRFPALAGLSGSTLLAVGLEYQPRGHVLKEGDVVSLFPPVQGG